MTQSTGQLRTTNGAADAPTRNGGPQAEPPDGFATINDLVADLVGITQLVSRDRLAAARGRAGVDTTLAKALEEEGVAQPEGIAMALARLHGVPYVDIARTVVPP